MCVCVSGLYFPLAGTWVPVGRRQGSLEGRVAGVRPEGTTGALSCGGRQGNRGVWSLRLQRVVPVPDETSQSRWGRTGGGGRSERGPSGLLMGAVALQGPGSWHPLSAPPASSSAAVLHLCPGALAAATRLGVCPAVWGSYVFGPPAPLALLPCLGRPHRGRLQRLGGCRDVTCSNPDSGTKVARRPPEGPGPLCACSPRALSWSSWNLGPPAVSGIAENPEASRRTPRHRREPPRHCGEPPRHR